MHVRVDETRPRNLRALTAWELACRRVPHTYIVDDAHVPICVALPSPTIDRTVLELPRNKAFRPLLETSRIA